MDADGSKYIGKWKNGQRQPQSIYIYVNGNKYIGEWKGRKFHGQGTLIWIDGHKYCRRI